MSSEEQKEEIELFPTVVPVQDFDPELDAKALYEGMEGIGTDEKIIIDIISNRSSLQLIEVEKKFRTLYGEDLKQMLKQELNGHLETVVIGRFYDKSWYHAFCIRRAMKGMGTDEQALVDILCSKTAKELKQLNVTYRALYERDLIEDIKSECSGDLERILVAVASAGREQCEEVDYELAATEAKALYDAGEGRWGTNEKVFINIFAHRSYPQLQATFMSYGLLSKYTLYDAIKKEMSGHVRSAFLTIAHFSKNPIAYWCNLLYESMKGVGTDDERLIRTVLSRCEIDLKTIRVEYEKTYRDSLMKAIGSETGGDYKKIMLSIVEDPTGLHLGLHKMLVSQEMLLLGSFSLGERIFEGRTLAIVETTLKDMQQFNGAWIYSIGKNIVALYDQFEVYDCLEHELQYAKKVTIRVYTAERPRSYFPKAPRQVGVSVNIISMCAIDTRKQNFEARLVMKTVWEPSPSEVALFKKKRYLSTGSGWRPRFVWANSIKMERRERKLWSVKTKDLSEKEPYKLTGYLLLQNGDCDPYGSVVNMLPKYLMYGEFEYQGTFTELLELNAFPLDCQDFSIICWSAVNSDKEQMVPFDLFLGNPSEMKGVGVWPLLRVSLSSSNIMNEWDIKNVNFSLENKSGQRSKMYMIVKARRRYQLYIWRMIIPVSLLVLASQTSFLLELEYGGDRVNVIFAAVLANVVYQLAVYGELPQIPYMTFLDWYNLFWFIFMLFILLVSAVIVFHDGEYFDRHFHVVGNDELRKVDLYMGILVLTLQLVGLIFFMCWGYKVYQREGLKLSLNYYEQIDNGLINPSKVDITLNSNEKVHSTVHELENEQKSHNWHREYIVAVK